MTRSFDSPNRPVALWLFVCAALVFGMVILGGVTRLTGSGLSIVEWEPLVGIVPPLTDADWQDLFQKYQASPEYQKVNSHFDVEAFKGIFWLEYLHRVLGRLLGLVFLLPFVYFLATRRIERSLVPPLLLAFVLGGLQGLVGWLMVASGLVDNPRVSQYRLTAHLLMAVLIYGYLLWLAWGLWYGRAGPAPLARLRRWATAALVLVLVTITSGAFVAGIDAGLGFNTFPLMAGQFVPPGYALLEPFWLNWFENVAAVQFNHRWLAIFTVACLLALWGLSLRQPLAPRLRGAFHLIAAVAVFQAGLGIVTLLSYVPVALASLHQTTALLLFTVLLYGVHALYRGGDGVVAPAAQGGRLAMAELTN